MEFKLSFYLVLPFRPMPLRNTTYKLERWPISCPGISTLVENSLTFQQVDEVVLVHQLGVLEDLVVSVLQRSMDIIALEVASAWLDCLSGPSGDPIDLVNCGIFGIQHDNTFGAAPREIEPLHLLGSMSSQDLKANEV